MDRQRNRNKKCLMFFQKCIKKVTEVVYLMDLFHISATKILFSNIHNKNV